MAKILVITCGLLAAVGRSLAQTFDSLPECGVSSLAFSLASLELVSFEGVTPSSSRPSPDPAADSYSVGPLASGDISSCLHSRLEHLEEVCPQRVRRTARNKVFQLRRRDRWLVGAVGKYRIVGW